MSRTKVVPFEIVVEFEPYQNIDASISADELLIDIGSLENYNDFVDGLVILLESNEFVIDRFDKSDRSISLSRYIVCHRVDEDDGSVIKCVFRVRVSDHALSAEARERQMKYWNSQKFSLEQDLKRRIARWRPKSIVVNDDTYRSYDDALRDMDNKIAQWHA